MKGKTKTYKLYLKDWLHVLNVNKYVYSYQTRFLTTRHKQYMHRRILSFFFFVFWTLRNVKLLLFFVDIRWWREVSVMALHVVTFTIFLILVKWVYPTSLSSSPVLTWGSEKSFT